jgi:hypothetical protein
MSINDKNGNYNEGGVLQVLRRAGWCGKGTHIRPKGCPEVACRKGGKVPVIKRLDFVSSGAKTIDLLLFHRSDPGVTRGGFGKGKRE